MSLLDSLLGFQRVFRDGVEIVRRRALDFVGDGWVIADNPSTGRTEAAVNVEAIAALAASQVDEAIDTHHITISTSDNSQTIDAALIGARTAANTHVHVRFTGAGAKKVTIAEDVSIVGFALTVYKSAASSSISVEATNRTVLGQSGEVLVQPTVAEERSFTLVGIGSNWHFLGVPRIDGAVGNALLADGAINGAKIASNAGIELSKLEARTARHVLCVPGASNAPPSSVALGQNRVLWRGTGDITTLPLQEGTYSPTVSNLVGYEATPTVQWAAYARIGDFVTASVALSCFFNDGTQKALEVTLPVARGSNFSSQYQAAGGGGVEYAAPTYAGGFVRSVSGAQRVKFVAPVSATFGSGAVHFQFSYRVS